MAVQLFDDGHVDLDAGAAGLDGAAYAGVSLERRLVPDGGIVCAIDEVGRGALAGPLTMAAVAVDPWAGEPPEVKDSKKMSSAAREAAVPAVHAWAAAVGIGECSAEEIDEIGMAAALRVAARRALDAVEERLRPEVIIVDGPVRLIDDPRVRTLVAADAACATVAAASVVAKVHRDRFMADLAAEMPGWGFEDNAGYASPEHLARLAADGPTLWHRRSWKIMRGLPGTDPVSTQGQLF